MIKKYKQFIDQFPYFVYQNAPLSRYCTFRVGGSADLLVIADSSKVFKTALILAGQLDIPYLVIGEGSNLFFDDKGFWGLIICYTANQITIQPDNAKVWAEAGCKLNALVNNLAEYNLGGLEFLANIPGSLGGAIVGNAGCYGKEIKDCLVDVDLFNCRTGKGIKIKPNKLGFRYRYSKLKKQNHLIVLSASLKIIKSKRSQILKSIAADWQLRKSKHPISKSAGSFFKNPSQIAAWKLIDAAGLRGATIGGARVSNKHSNHIVNYNGKATAKDIIKLASLVVDKVKRQTGITLDWEVQFIPAACPR